MRRSTVLLRGLFFALSLSILVPPSVAHADPPPPPTAIAIEHATLFLPNRPPLADATLVMVGKTIRAVGASVPIPPGALRIDAHGKLVTPGFIDPSTTLGIVDVSLEPSTNDSEGHDRLSPALRVADAYNPRSILIPIARRGGVTSAVVGPSGGILSGESAFVDLAGETAAEAIVRPSLAENARIDESAAEQSGGSRGAAWMRLREAFADAQFYATHKQAYGENRTRSLGLPRVQLEALVPVLRGERPLVVTAHRASDIEAVLRLADEWKLKVILSGASEAWLVAGELARRKIPVILDAMGDLPTHFDRLHVCDDQAARLTRAGVPVMFSTFAAHQVRLLWQQAGNAVRFGMDHDAAIRAMTEVPASAFGLAGYGRLEPNAVANVVLWEGDPLETSGRAERVFVRGREVSLETRQTKLLERYRTVPARRWGGPETTETGSSLKR